MGYLVILQGMLDELRGIPLPEAGDEAAPSSKEKADFSSFSTDEITFGYCTEFYLLPHRKKRPQALRGFLSALGDSLVLVDGRRDHQGARPHRPSRAGFGRGAHLRGAAYREDRKHAGAAHRDPVGADAPAADAGRTIAPPEKKAGFVAVCAGEGLTAVFRDLGADGIISGGQTMNPSTEDILREIDRTPAELVYVLPNNKNIIMARQQCVPLAQGKRVVIIPTSTVAQGISALLASDPDAAPEDNAAAMTQAAERVRTVEITYAARDSDFDGTAIRQGGLSCPLRPSALRHPI